MIIGLRPEHLEVATNGSNGKPVLRAPVTLAEPVGAQVIVHLDLATVRAGDQGGDFCACLDARRPCSRGETLTLAVDPTTLHFFDPSTEISASVERAGTSVGAPARSCASRRTPSDPRR
ncbi:MAG TPA: TOBE domain-containing protein [Gaiellaceae bacterium]|nr:TOBE domain-containing protein [Gaiellaceae bacterium]